MLLGIVIPMSIVLVVSALGNFVRFSRLRGAAGAAADVGAAAVSSSPQSVVVGRSV
jgi:hypothetical protein